MNPKDRKIVIGVLVFSVLIIIGVGFGIGFATRPKASTDKTNPAPGVQTPTPGGHTAAPTTSPALPSGSGYGPYSQGAVAADAGKCSEIGRDILAKGGSAVDSAIAATFCIGVINMHSAGIGGGGFMLVYNKTTGTAETLDFREEAPQAATQDMFLNISSTTGGKSTGIPGEVKGLYRAYQKYGHLKWKELVQPAIDLAANGFPIHTPLFEAMGKRKEYIKADVGLKQLLFTGDDMKKFGETVVNPQLAITLEKIREKPMSFYDACLANEIVRDIKRANGIITTKDLRDYEPIWKEALRSDLSDLTFFTTAPPSSGAVITMILNILKGFNMTEADRANDVASALTYHRIIEAFKYGYAMRAKLGDPDFASPEYANISEVLKNMTNPNLAEKLRKKINDSITYHDASHYGAFYSGTGQQGTSHLSILAPNGDAVSLTTTINFWFGAKYRSPVTGIIYNNEMDDFSTPGKPNGYGVKPSPSNYVKAGKRPMSSISPVIFVRQNDSSVYLVAGASGGTFITTATSLVIMNKLWFGKPLDVSVSEPRVHNQLSNTTFEVKNPQYTMSAAIRKGLAERGNYLIPDTTYAVVQAISKEGNDIFAQSDPRKHGWAAGL